MGLRNFLGDSAERLGVEVLGVSRAGVRHWRDIARVRPLARIATVFDVGAHRGETALLYARKAPNARIFSFEPAPANYELLSRAVAGHARIQCARTAVGSAAGELPLYEGRSSQEHSLVPHGCATSATLLRTPVATVDDLARDRGVDRIDLLKTDTEGFDLDVMRGATGLLARHAIDFIYAEVGFSRDDTQHTYFIDLFEFLGERGYRLLGLYDVMPKPSPWRIAFANALFTHL